MSDVAFRTASPIGGLSCVKENCVGGNSFDNCGLLQTNFKTVHIKDSRSKPHRPPVHVDLNAKR